MEVKQNENIQKNIIVGKLNIEKKYIYSWFGSIWFGLENFEFDTEINQLAWFRDNPRRNSNQFN